MPLPEHVQEELAMDIHARGMILFGNLVQLHAADRVSPYYFDARGFQSVNPNLAASGQMSAGEQLAFRNRMLSAYAGLLLEVPVPYDHVVGKAQAGTPIAAAAADRAGLSLLWERIPEGKTYSKGKPPIEGDYREGQRVTLADEVITDGESKITGAQTLTDLGLVPVAVTVILDRNEGGAERLQAAGYEFGTLTSLTGLAKFLSANKRWGNRELDRLAAYHERIRAAGKTSTFQLPS